MENTYLLRTEQGKRLYQTIKDLPIIDYHCHLSPKEIYEDKPFDNIGEMWLAGDHYKWRLMRAVGIEEFYITGKATWREKFQKFAEMIALAAGNPIYHWTQMELNQYFDIQQPLNGSTAETIWEQVNQVVKDLNYSPRKLITRSKVTYIATTDDVIDDLSYHQKIKADETFRVTVTPSFRTDNLLLLRRANYADYISKLSAASGINVNNIDSFQSAICDRLDFFCRCGCKFTDVGIEYFPDHISSPEEAAIVFEKALTAQPITDEQYLGFLGYMYLFLGSEYQKRELVMQWHLAVKRNANTEQLERMGADTGGDCMGDVIPNKSIIYILDAINSNSGLPRTILYALNPAMSPSLSTIAGSFRGVQCGAAWWFCDHKRGIREQIENIAETGHLGMFLGMLTDSRSFLSYARHDYFRRILCDILGEWIEQGELANDEGVLVLLKKICYDNVLACVGGENL